MSGPDERRGTDGGEHPLDVDALEHIVRAAHDGDRAALREQPTAVLAGAATAGRDDVAVVR